jgi:subtilase family serine protease
MYQVLVLKKIIIFAQVVNVLLTSLIVLLLLLVIMDYINVQMAHVKKIIVTANSKSVKEENITVGMEDVYLNQNYAQQEVLVLMNTLLNVLMALVKLTSPNVTAMSVVHHICLIDAPLVNAEDTKVNAQL